MLKVKRKTVRPVPAHRLEDCVAFITKYEAGDCTQEEVIEGFQALVNTGLVWQLQGNYGRTARALIDAGFVTG
jgi:hypothetical protein